jgi:hypothetical protein
MTVIISFSDSNDSHLLVQGKEDGVAIADGSAIRDGAPAWANTIFVPDTAVLPLIRALQEYEEMQQTRLQNSWGV